MLTSPGRPLSKEMAAPSTVRQSGRTPLASAAHLVVILLILAGIAASGYISQGKAVRAPVRPVQGSDPARQFAMDIGLELALLLYVWVGVRRRGGKMSDLTGGRWLTWKEAATDAAIAVPFWLLWTLAAKAIWWLLHPPLRQGANFNFPPHGTLNIAAWLALAATAGFCEEVLYRGYLQKQFHAFTGSIVLAVLAQALIFGSSHVYKGPKDVVVTSVLGLLYGLLAQWRGSLRPGVLSHAWSDMFEGYFKFLLPTV